MSEYIDDFYASHKALIIATLTDVVSMWEAEQLDAVPWDEVTLPAAVILTPSLPKTDNWGCTWNAYAPMVEVYYLSATTGPQSVIRTKLELLRDAYLTTGLTTGQVLDVPDICWSDELQANVVIASKNYAQGAGRVTVQCVVGEVYP